MCAHVCACTHAEIKAIDMGNNTISREGAAALADLLRGNTSLADVNINMNDVGDDGAFSVSRRPFFSDPPSFSGVVLPFLVPYPLFHLLKPLS